MWGERGREENEGTTGIIRRQRDFDASSERLSEIAELITAAALIEFFMLLICSIIRKIMRE